MIRKAVFILALSTYIYNNLNGSESKSDVRCVEGTTIKLKMLTIEPHQTIIMIPEDYHKLAERIADENNVGCLTTLSKKTHKAFLYVSAPSAGQLTVYAQQIKERILKVVCTPRTTNAIEQLPPPPIGSLLRIKSPCKYQPLYL